MADDSVLRVRLDVDESDVYTKILETLVELDTGQRLPLGLRVDAYVESAEKGAFK
jgi:hypothetical protein